MVPVRPPPWWPDWQGAGHSLPELLRKVCSRWVRAGDGWETGHPFQRDQLDGLPVLAGRFTMNEFGLVQASDRLGQGVVVAVVIAAHRGLNADLGQAFA